MEQWCEVRPASQRPKTGPPGYCRGTPGLSGRLVGLHPLPRSGPDDGIPRRSFAPASIIIRPLRRTRRSRRTCPRASAGNMQGGSAGSCRRNSGSTPRTCVSDSPTAPDARPTAVKPRPLRRTTTAGTTSTPTFSACLLSDRQSLGYACACPSVVCAVRVAARIRLLRGAGRRGRHRSLDVSRRRRPEGEHQVVHRLRVGIAGMCGFIGLAQGVDLHVSHIIGGELR